MKLYENTCSDYIYLNNGWNLFYDSMGKQGLDLDDNYYDRY